MSYNTENGAALQKLPEKPHDKGKPKNKMFSKNTKANRPEPSAQSEQIETEQCKQKKFTQQGTDQ